MTVTYPRVFKFFSFELFILYWGLPTSHVVIVSGEQQRDSGIHVRVPTPRAPLPSRLPVTLSRVPCVLH